MNQKPATAEPVTYNKNTNINTKIMAPKGSHNQAQEELVSIGEAARLLRVSINTLRGWDAEGKLCPVLRKGGRFRYYKLADLHAFKKDRPLSVTEAARVLGLSASTLRRLEARGVLLPDRGGNGKRLYSRELLRQYRQERSRAPQQFAPSPPASAARGLESQIPQPARIPEPVGVSGKIQPPRQFDATSSTDQVGAMREPSIQSDDQRSWQPWLMAIIISSLVSLVLTSVVVLMTVMMLWNRDNAPRQQSAIPREHQEVRTTPTWQRALQPVIDFFRPKVAHAAAGMYDRLSFQGKVVNSNGTNVTDGTYTFEFKVYDGTASGSSALWTETWSTASLLSTTMSTAPGAGGESLVYVSDTNESSLKVGQTLWNTTKGEAVTITSVNTSTNTLGISPTRQAWATSDTITNAIYVKDGVFSIQLNSLNENWSSVNWNDDSIFLGVNFNSDGEMKPRKRFTSVPYAHNASLLDGLDSGSLLRSDASDTYSSGTLTFSTGTGINLNDITVSGTTFTINGTNFDVSSGGEITIAPGAGLDTNAAGTLELGKTNATAVDVCNSVACDAIAIGSTGATFSVASTAFTLTTAGEVSGVSTLSSSGDWTWTAGTPTITINNGEIFTIVDDATPDTFTIDTSGSLFSFSDGTNSFTFDVDTGPLYAGTARPTKRITLIPEYSGAVLTSDAGGDNTGTMRTDFCSNGNTNPPDRDTTSCPTSGDLHNFYNWTTTQASAQDYEVWIPYQIPSDFGAFASSSTIQVYGWRTNSTDELVEVSLYDDADTQCGSTTNVATGTATWTQTALTGDETSCSNIAAGDIVTFRVRMVAGQNDTVKVGEISFEYRAKF